MRNVKYFLKERLLPGKYNAIRSEGAAQGGGVGDGADGPAQFPAVAHADGLNPQSGEGPDQAVVRVDTGGIDQGVAGDGLSG